LNRESLVAVLHSAQNRENSSQLVALEDVAITGQLRESTEVNLVDAQSFILTHPAREGKEGLKEKIVICLQGYQGLVDRVWKDTWGRVYTSHSTINR